VLKGGCDTSCAGAPDETIGAMHTINPPVDNVLWVKVNGKLTKEEYADLIPSWEQMIARHGKLRLLFQMEPGFEGWEPLAAWDDLKFSLSHGNELERVAMVGARKWEQFFAKLGSLLVNSEVRFFEETKIDEAQRWLRE
jgi:AAA+ ATPase superfamily predicted ATPase